MRHVRYKFSLSRKLAIHVRQNLFSLRVISMVLNQNFMKFDHIWKHFELSIKTYIEILSRALQKFY